MCRIPAQASGRKHPAAEMIEIDTTNILFIAGGAFVGLDNIVKSRTRGTSIGFSSPVAQVSEATLLELEPDDLVRFGLIPEFVGRFPNVVTLNELSRDDLKLILTTVKDNYISQYQWLFEHDQIDLRITDDAVEAIMDQTQKTKTGARGLQAQLEKTLLPHMFDIKRYQQQGIKHVDITTDLVNNPTSILGE